MRTGIIFFSVVLSLLLALEQEAGAQQKIKSIVKKNMAALEPFQYDAYAMKEITYGPKEQSVVVEFTCTRKKNIK